jgi:aquaglyceroporin related protein
MLGVFVSRESGGHLNHVVTLTLCVFRKFPWKKFIPYITAQLLGAIAGAAAVYLNYRLAIDEFEGHGMRTVFGTTSTAEIFSTYPAAFLTTEAQFFSIPQGNFSNVR